MNKLQEDSYLQGHDPTRHHETLRLIQQYLAATGFSTLAKDLALQSGVPKELPVVSDFKNTILTQRLEPARFPAILASLQQAGVLAASQVVQAELLLFE